MTTSRQWVTTALILPLCALLAPSAAAEAPRPVAKAVAKEFGPQQRSGHTAAFSGATPFTVLGVTWAAGSNVKGLEVTARYQQAKGWSAWEALDVPNENAPEKKESARAPRAGTAPLAAPDATAYEVRVSAQGALPDGIKVVAVSPGTDVATASAPQTQRQKHAKESPGASALGSAAAPIINNRASWGADDSKLNCGPNYAAAVQAVAVHHTAGSNSYTAAQVPGILRSIFTYHTDSLGWCDIGYNVLVDRFGRLWEGRAGGLNRDVVPAAQHGFNTGASAISAMGSFQATTAPSAMVEAIASFVSWRLGLEHVDPTSSTVMVSKATDPNPKWRNGTSVKLGTVFAHRNVNFTDCPGDYLYSRLATIRTRARQLTGSAAVFDPAVNFTQLQTNTFPAFRVNAHTASSQTFALSVLNAAGVEVYRTTGQTLGLWFSAVWDRRDTAGRVVPAGTYRLRITSQAGSVAALPWEGTVSVIGSAPPPGDPAILDSVNRTPGARYTSTHQWRTTCVPYSTATRCQVEILSGGVWRSNNYAYHDQGSTSWAGNVQAKPGTYTTGGSTYRTACAPSVATGPRSCRTDEWKPATGTWMVNSYVWLGDGR